MLKEATTVKSREGVLEGFYLEVKWPCFRKYFCLFIKS